MPLITSLMITTAVCAPLSLLLIIIGIMTQHNCSREHTRHVKELVQLKRTQIYNGEYPDQIEGLTT